MTLDDTTTQLTRAERLRSANHTTHDALDTAIMAAKPFDSLTNYGRFLKVQYAFHRDVSPLYTDVAVAALIPDLASLSRLDAVARDIASIGAALPGDTGIPAATGLAVPEALGWLYVVEGSNLGAAFLLKAAKKMGLSETHGASHLAEAPAGRAAHWRLFKDAFNAVEFTEVEDARVIAGANAAFVRVRALVDLHLG